MASQTKPVQTAPFCSSYVGSSLFMPFFLSLTGADPTPAGPDPVQDSANGSDPRSGGVILVNPFTRGMVVVGKQGRSPAMVEAVAAVEVEENDAGECAICLDELKAGGGVVRETPCKHRFHGGCVERWLEIYRSCPVCRFPMTCRRENGRKNSIAGGGRG